MRLVTPNNELNEDGIKQALMDARGDIFIASSYLNISPLRMQKYIHASPCLSVTLEETQKGRERDQSALAASVEAALASRLSTYRVVGLDSLFDIATMPISENSAQNQVKLAAAARLAGETAANAGDGGMASILQSLNADYHSNAPRIRVTRERMTVEVSGGASDTPVTIQHAPQGD